MLRPRRGGRRRPGLFPLWLATALSLSGCATKPPEWDDSGGTAEIPPLPVGESSIIVPVAIDIPTPDDIDKAFCTFQKRHQAFTGLAYRAEADFEVWLKEKPAVALHAGKMETTISTYYWVKGAFASLHLPLASSSCGWNKEFPREIRMTMESRFDLSRDWQFSTATKLAKVENPSLCKVAFGKIDVTPQVNAIVGKVAEVAIGKVEEKVKERSNIRPLAEIFWSTLNQPIEIRPNAWLRLNPFYVARTRISIDSGDTKARMTLQIKAKPAIQFGRKPDSVSSPLPGIEYMEETSDEFRIVSDAVLRIEDINKRLASKQSKLVGRKIPIRKSTITITGARIKASGRKIIAAVDVKTKTANPFAGLFVFKTGTLYFTMTPEYNEASRTVYFSDMDYHVDTQRFLLGFMTRWILKSPLLGQLKEHLVVGVGPTIDNFTGSLEKKLNKKIADGITLATVIEESEIQGIFVDKDALLVRVESKGKVKVEVTLPGRLPTGGLLQAR